MPRNTPSKGERGKSAENAPASPRSSGRNDNNRRTEPGTHGRGERSDSRGNDRSDTRGNERSDTRGNERMDARGNERSGARGESGNGQRYGNKPRRGPTGAVGGQRAGGGQRRPGSGSPAGSGRPAGGTGGLVRDITAMLGKMNEDSLRFLKRQAEVLVSAAEYKDVRRQTLDALSRLEKGSNRRPAPNEVEIVRRDDSFFNIAVRGTRVFFNIDEMRALTKICHSATDAADGANRLFTWFNRERDDFLKDAGIKSAADPALLRLHEIIIATYKVKS